MAAHGGNLAAGRDTALEEAYATMDFSGEKVLYEGPPSTGDLVTNVALGFTLLWLVRSLVPLPLALSMHEEKVKARPGLAGC